MTQQQIKIRLFTAKELARHFRVDHQTVRRWEKDGKLKGTRIGGSLRFSALDVDQFIETSEKRADQ